ncbi:MAG: hypothetical protein ACE5KQ_04740 [Thermoplasmata archaeon]
MTLLDGDSLSQIFELPLDDILALPDLLTEDLERGLNFILDDVQTRPPRRRPTIHIPGIDDIIHIIPETFLPQAEQDRRRRDRARRIAESPTPESVRAIGSILTFVDDVQDALVTASVLARIGATFLPRLRPIAVATGAAAEAINIFSLAGQVAATPLTGKFRAQRASVGLAGGQVARALSARTLAQALPTVGETVQILQTTDQLFGVGLSLGPIVGLFEDLIFGSLQGAEFAFQSGIRYRPNDELFLREEDQRRAEALDLLPLLAQITRGARAAAWVLASPPGLPFSDRLDSLALLSIIAELARGFLPESNWQPIVLPALDSERPATGQLRPQTIAVLRDLGITAADTETFPTEGNPAMLSTRRMAEVLLAQGPEPLSDWLSEGTSATARLFAEQLATDLPFRFIRAFEGPSVGFEVHGSPIWRAVLDSMELGLIPPRGSPDVQIRTYLENAADLYREEPDRKIPLRQLGELHTRIFTPPPPKT